MSKNKIIEKLARQKTVERLVAKQGLSTPYKKDLCQDIYICLLQKDQSLLEKLDDAGEFSYYITKIIKNNVNSVTSPYYKNYEKFRILSEDIKYETTEI